MAWTYPDKGGFGYIPNGFSIGSFEIRFYALCIVSGMLIAIIMAIHEAKKIGVNSDHLYTGGVIGLLLGVIGARVYYIIFELDYYLSLGNFFDVIKGMLDTRSGGLAIHGGIIVAIIFSIIYCKKRQMDLWKVFDLLAPGLLIGQICGRWGNFFNQEAHGGETTRMFLENTLHLPTFITDNMYFYSDGILAYWHPTFLYEFLWNMILFIAILVVRRIRFLKVGDILPIYLIWYSIGRFFIEGMRTDSLMIGALRQNQVISVILVYIGIIILVLKRVYIPNQQMYFDEIHKPEEVAND